MFAKPDGTFLRLIRYDGGLASLVPLADADVSEEKCVYIAKVNMATTKGNPADEYNGGEIDAAIVKASRVTTVYIVPNPVIGSHTGSGDGGDDKLEDEFYDFSNGKAPLRNTLVIVNAISNNAEFGSVKGGGSYVCGSTATLTAKANTNCVAKPEYSPVFDRWSGDVSSTAMTITVKVGEDELFLCGNFKRNEDIDRPCVSESGNSNPLQDCFVAGTTEGGSFRQGMYNATRHRPDGTVYHHQGVDFYAYEGTPIFAPADGIITRMLTKCPKGEAGKKYGGCYGNLIELTDGNGTSFFFAHLQVGNPVAVNLWTGNGETYKLGDVVHKGDLIGYTGTSGNACSVPNPHLHYEVRRNGQRIDPSSYINGAISKNGVVIIADCNGTKK